MQKPPWRHGPRWIWDFGLLVEKGAAEKGVVVTGAETNHPVWSWLVYSHHATHGFATGRHFRSAQIAKKC